MPAARSRTERWRDCLRQIRDRNGAIEITLPRPSDGDGHGVSGGNLLWRVRILEITDSEILVECPSAMGQAIHLQTDLELVAVLTIGQNRWMFHTHTAGYIRHTLHGGTSVEGLRLRMPDRVERCQRRAFYRISTAALALPVAQCWPILDLGSVTAAEIANRATVTDMYDADISGRVPASDSAGLLPEVGPGFEAQLVNISGGGVGLMLTRDVAQSLDRARYFWVRINLDPEIPAPIGVTTRLAHQRIDSAQNIYAGMAFEFGHNPQHQRFIVEQICRYVATVQRAQLAHRNPADPATDQPTNR